MIVLVIGHRSDGGMLGSENCAQPPRQQRSTPSFVLLVLMSWFEPYGTAVLIRFGVLGKGGDIFALQVSWFDE